MYFLKLYPHKICKRSIKRSEYILIILIINSIVVEKCLAAVKINFLQKMPNILDRPLTISGFSSGGTMAAQMQIAFSKNFDGAAMFAGIWYRCAPQGQLFERQECFTGIYSVDKGIIDARNYAIDDKIDPLINLKYQKHYHYIGRMDEIARPDVRTKTKKFFEEVGMKKTNIYLKYQRAYHSMPTVNKSEIPCTQPVFGTALEEGLPPNGIAYCNYNGAYEALNFLLNNTLDSPKQSIKIEPLNFFNQSVFLEPSDQKYMDDRGFYYLPSKCKNLNVKCRFHVVLHGCMGYRQNIKSDFVKRSGYLQTAELNNIFLLFPQSIPFQKNNEGCWDVFGATGIDYAMKTGVQMDALRRMIETVLGKRFD